MMHGSTKLKKEGRNLLQENGEMQAFNVTVQLYGT